MRNILWAILFQMAGLSIVMAQPSANYIIPLCEDAPGGYSLTRAQTFVDYASDATIDCYQYVSAGFCQLAAENLYKADVNLWQVWSNSVDSRNNCWRCNPKKIYSIAAKLEELTKAYNSIVIENGLARRSDANYTQEAIQTWKGTPYCAYQPINPRDVNEPLHGSVLENQKCRIGIYSNNPSHTSFDIDLYGDQCHLVYRQFANGFIDYRIYLAKSGGYAQSRIPSGYIHSHVNVCNQILQQAERGCGF